MHILFLIQELNMGQSPNINNKNAIEGYCKKFLQLLSEHDFEKIVLDAAERFRKLRRDWISIKGNNYIFSIKDNPEFTSFMLTELRGNENVKELNSVYHGIVVNVTTDKNGNLIGFISPKPGMNNIYFNEIDNPKMNLSYEGKKVTYKISRTNGKERAINVSLI